MLAEWQPSAHARARTSAVYLAMQKQAADPVCDGCHAPLATRTSGPAGREGVSCDACHTLRAVTPGHARAEITLATDDMVRYGPLCDAKDHYFHRMGCSPLHTEAELCAACHLWRRPLAGGGWLPVFTEYADWKDGPYATEGVQCQTCHMPGDEAEVAVGSPPRPAVPHHGFLGRDGGLRKTALTLTVTLSREGGDFVLETLLANVGAGHFVPAGLPERRILLTILALSGDKQATTTMTYKYGRVLTDDAGKEVPFYLATKQGKDSRIPPRGSIKDVVRFPPDAGIDRGSEILIRVLERPLSEEMAAALGVPAPADHLLLETTLSASKLPITVKVPK